MFPHQPLIDGPFAQGRVSIAGAGTFPGREVHASYRPASRIGVLPESARSESGADRNGYEQVGARMELVAEAEVAPGGTLREFISAYDLWEGDTLPLSGHALFLPVRTVTSVSHRVEPIQTELSEATLAGQKDQILSLLKDLDPRILDVQILSPRGKRPVIYIEYASNGLLPLSAFGDGVRRAFLIALYS